MGIAALVLGIISFVIAVTFVLAPLGVMLAVIGLILGIVATVKKEKAGEKKAISITGLILCAVMFVTLMVESFCIFLVGIAVYETANANDITMPVIEREEMERKSFNSKFSSYEGTRTGSSVKILLSSISTNNVHNKDHKIDVYYNSTVEEPDDLIQKIKTTQRYTVTLYKDIDGYINRVYIILAYNSNTTDDNSILNNNTIGSMTNLL